MLIVITVFTIARVYNEFTLDNSNSPLLDLSVIAERLAFQWNLHYRNILFGGNSIFFLTLGNFHDFREIQNLLLPLLIVVFTSFVSKPAYNAYTKSNNFTKNVEEDKKQLAEEKETEVN